MSSTRDSFLRSHFAFHKARFGTLGIAAIEIFNSGLKEMLTAEHSSKWVSHPNRRLWES